MRWGSSLRTLAELPQAGERDPGPHLPLLDGLLTVQTSTEAPSSDLREEQEAQPQSRLG